MFEASIIGLIILVGAIFLLWHLTSKKKQARQQEAAELQLAKNTNPTIENVRKGGVLKLTSVGPEMEDMDLEVLSRHTYRQGASSWYELECSRGDGKVWLTIEEDDDVEVAVALQKLKLRDIGITKETLATIDDEEEGSFKFGGEKFWYEDSDRAIYYRNSLDKEAERFYYWEFENDAGNAFISVEKWSDGSFDVTLSEPVKPSQITVYTLNGSS